MLKPQDTFNRRFFSPYKKESTAMSHDAETANNPPTAAAERMRAHRERRRLGLRCLMIQLRETEIDTLIRKPNRTFGRKSTRCLCAPVPGVVAKINDLGAIMRAAIDKESPTSTDVAQPHRTKE
jgi:hypothetical protein